jgi:hypothetical protein
MKKKCPQCNQNAKPKDIRPLFVSTVTAVDASEIDALESRLQDAIRGKAAMEANVIRLTSQCERLNAEVMRLRGLLSSQSHVPPPPGYSVRSDVTLPHFPSTAPPALSDIGPDALSAFLHQPRPRSASIRPSSLCVGQCRPVFPAARPPPQTHPSQRLHQPSTKAFTQAFHIGITGGRVICPVPTQHLLLVSNHFTDSGGTGLHHGILQVCCTKGTVIAMSRLHSKPVRDIAVQATPSSVTS